MNNVADIPNGFVHYELSWATKLKKMRVRLKRDREKYATELFSKRWDLLSPEQVAEVNAARSFWLFDEVLGKAKVIGCDNTGCIFVYGKLLIKDTGQATFWRRETHG